MNARAALFDLYGDHLRQRGGGAPIAAIIRLLEPLEVAPPAARTAVSRMVRQGWLSPTRTPAGPGYAATDRARQRLDEAAARIYGGTGTEPWTGRWSILVVEPTSQRSKRERLHRELEYLGFRLLHGTTWISPRPSVEAEAVIRVEGLSVDGFLALPTGDQMQLVDRLYDLDKLARAYRSWLVEAKALVESAGRAPEERTAFATRSQLVHEWRKFLFRDPGLPGELLPESWPGHEAREFFDAEAGRLQSGASAFVDCCLGGASDA